jgi:hypothetical protein
MEKGCSDKIIHFIFRHNGNKKNVVVAEGYISKIAFLDVS